MVPPSSALSSLLLNVTMSPGSSVTVTTGNASSTVRRLHGIVEYRRGLLVVLDTWRGDSCLELSVPLVDIRTGGSLLGYLASLVTTQRISPASTPDDQIIRLISLIGLSTRGGRGCPARLSDGGHHSLCFRCLSCSRGDIRPHDKIGASYCPCVHAFPCQDIGLRAIRLDRCQLGDPSDLVS